VIPKAATRNELITPQIHKPKKIYQRILDSSPLNPVSYGVLSSLLHERRIFWDFSRSYYLKEFIDERRDFRCPVYP
jgi:hypothetical protein